MSSLAPECTHYWATDISPAVLRSLEQQLPEQIASRVTLLPRMAHDFAGIEAGLLDAIVLNDAVRRFPGIEYLVHVLQHALQVIRPDGVIFVGNIGSLSLCEAHHTFLKMHEGPASLPREQLWHRVYKGIAEEERLLIDPAFFVALPQHLLQITRVQLLLRREGHTRSFARFHYDVLLWIGTNPASRGELFDDPTVCQIDWEEKQFTVAAIRQWLIEEAPEQLHIRRIPHTQLFKDMRVIELLKGYQGYKTVGEMREALQAVEEAEIEPEVAMGFR